MRALRQKRGRSTPANPLGRAGTTPAWWYLNKALQDSLGYKHAKTSTTHQRWLALCRDGKQTSTGESKQAALAIPHFEVTFILLGTETGVKQLEKQQD